MLAFNQATLQLPQLLSAAPSFQHWSLVAHTSGGFTDEETLTDAPGDV